MFEKMKGIMQRLISCDRKEHACLKKNKGNHGNVSSAADSECQAALPRFPKPDKKPALALQPIFQ